jgi:chitin disaccharide deacetylase
MTTSEPPAAARHLIVNADDFGLSAAVNAGVVEAHDHGVVTSASLMVRWPEAAAAVRLATDRPRLSLGLHVDLGEWEPMPDGAWVTRHTVVDTGDAEAVAAEVHNQLATFERLVGAPPTHLDGHQHVQRSDAPRGVMNAVASRLGVPLRLHDPRVVYRGDFYGQGSHSEPYPEGITVGAFIAAPGWNEMSCHPGIGVGPETSVYAAERAVEVQVLCNTDVVTAIRRLGIGLCSFADLRGPVL